MSIASDNRISKQQKILDCALQIIKEQGDAGLTMRKLAESSGMRLSNVQYYFKAKDDVLTAMVASYFKQCEEELSKVTEGGSELNQRDRIHRLLTEVLHHGTELSDMCRVFRELWAIATRNEAVRVEMERYYQNLCSLLGQAVLGSDSSKEQEQHVVSLLLPYIEGYSITASSLPLKMEDVTDVITHLTMALIDDT
ncbi:MAG: TetR/AcrR family transcriptional regulator [Pseudomonadota bacterium]